VPFTCPQGYSIERLAAHHNRTLFTCEEDALTRYLREQAGQEKSKGVSATHVLLGSEKDRVIGFCTIAKANVPLTNFPGIFARKLTRQTLVPATLIARIAVDSNYRGRRLGELLLLYGLYVGYTLSADSGSAVVIVDAKNDRAISFYGKYGFQKLPVESRAQTFPNIIRVWRPRSNRYPCRMFLPMNEVKKLI
jgi:ribosomal protein S18 acetylase RimI-like enzyme